VAFLLFVATVAVTKRVSAGSLVAAVALPAGLMITRGVTSPLALIGSGIAVFVIWLHRGNIARLRAGTEPKIGLRPRGEDTA